MPLTRSDLDLRHVTDIASTLDQAGIDGLINCAAFTDVEGAEENEDLATTVNGEAVATMAEWAADRGHPFLTFSTDYVFDGRASSPYKESSPTRPINAYGRSKLTGELAALSVGSLVVRTSWLVSGSHPNFVATVIRTASQWPMRIVSDQIGSPSITSDVAARSWEAISRDVRGLLHVTNEGSASWFDLAHQALLEAGMDPGLVTACASDDYPNLAKRPAYSVMVSERFGELGLSPLPHWTESLRGVVSEILEKT